MISGLALKAAAAGLCDSLLQTLDLCLRIVQLLAKVGDLRVSLLIRFEG